MVDTRYKRNSGSVFTLKFHFVWCPKYRRKVLLGDVKTRLEELLKQKSVELGIEIETLEIMPDHVHIFVSSEPTYAPQHIANQLKGYSSRILRSEFPHLRSQLPSLWSRSYYVGSIGQVSEETVKRYIEQQRKS
jgi:putative transposase